MAITVRNVLELPNLKEFRLAAGEKGLGNPVEKTGIVDYEFTEGYPIDEVSAFDRNSFVISSLLFAKDDEAVLLRAVKRLIDFGVSALGIKTVFYKDIPDEVRKLADQAGFCIFLFDTAYFEDVINDLRQAVQSADLLLYEGERLQKLFSEELSVPELRRIASELHPAMGKWVQVYSCQRRQASSQWENSRAISRFAKNSARKSETAGFLFDDAFLFFVSFDHCDGARLHNQFSDALYYAGVAEEPLVIGCGGIYPAEDSLAVGLREAVYARRAAVLMGRGQLSYREAGLVGFLLWNRQDHVRQGFAEGYLAPILNEGKGGIKSEGKAEGPDLFSTAVAYVRAEGSIPETARKLFIHENTVRYRIGKLRERLAPGAGEYVFYQNLAAAVWLMLAQEAGYL